MLGIFGAVLMKEEGMKVFISDVSQVKYILIHLERKFFFISQKKEKKL